MQLDAIIATLFAGAEAYLDGPSEASQRVVEVRGELQALGRKVQSKAARDALRALAGAESDLRRARAKEFGEAVAATLRPLGIVLVPQAPLRRRRRVKEQTTAEEPPSPRGEGVAAPAGQGEETGSAATSLGDGAKQPEQSNASIDSERKWGFGSRRGGH